jgi:hypothetical protein
MQRTFAARIFNRYRQPAPTRHIKLLEVIQKRFLVSPFTYDQ